MALPTQKHRLWERILVLSWLVLLWGLATSLYHGTSAELLSGRLALVTIGALGGVATLASWAALGGRETTSGKDLTRVLGTRIGAFLVVVFCNGLGLYLVLHSSVRELYMLTCSPENATVVVEGRPTLAKCGQPNFLSADNVLAAYAPGFAPDSARAVMDRDRDADYHIDLKLEPLRPWSCRVAATTEHSDPEDLQTLCPTPASDAPAWTRAETLQMDLDASAPRATGRRRVIASSPDASGVGVALRPSAPADECRSESGLPVGNPFESEMILGPGCVAEADQKLRISLELTLCVAGRPQLPDVGEVQLLLTPPGGESAIALDCKNARP